MPGFNGGYAANRVLGTLTFIPGGCIGPNGLPSGLNGWRGPIWGWRDELGPGADMWGGH